MAFNAKFYKFSKKKNSTARPSGGDDYTVKLKAETEILNPTIILKVATYPDYNYAFIAEFDRYYFVRAITWEMGNWNMSLEVDPLASWKVTIGSQSLYVTRGASDFRGDIQDSSYQTVKDVVQTLVLPNSGGSPWEDEFLDLGTFVVGIIGTSVNYYAMSPTEWVQFQNALYSEDYLDDIVPNWATQFQDIKARVNPIQFITSLIWFPFIIGGASAQDVQVGYGTLENRIVNKLDGAQKQRFLRSFNIPQHPQAGTRGVFLNTRPYSDYQLFYPPFGKFTLNPDIVSDSEADLLDTYVDVDLRTGQATLSVQAGVAGSNLLTWASAQVGVNYQVSQVMNSGMSLGQIAQAGAGLAAGAVFGGVAGLAGAALAGGAGAIGDYVNGKIPSATMVGSQGGINTLQGVPTLIVEQYELVAEDLVNRGRPLCELRTISALSGYMEVNPANVSIPAQSSELDTIKQYMEGGFYYE